jgi:hypothetical protein
MAGLALPSPSFDGLLDSKQPKDTQVVIEEEASVTSSATAGSGGELSTSSNKTTLAAHWVILWGHSTCFRAKVRGFKF